jgi:hypothetical protein
VTPEAAPAPAPHKRPRWPLWTAIAGGAVVTGLALGVGLGVGLSPAIERAPAPMLGSAATFDTRHR